MDASERPAQPALLTWMQEEMAELRAMRSHDPFANPVLLLAVQLEQRWASGRADLAAVDEVVQSLTLAAARERAHRLRGYLGESDEAANAERQRALFRALPESWAAFRDAVERPRYGFVFTAHPTFAHDGKVHVDLLCLALQQDDQGRPLDAAGARAVEARLGRIDHRATQPIDLTVEHRWSLGAIDRLRAALTNAHRRVLEVARERFPDRWRELRPQLATVATWVGYDLDGRADIPWRTTVAKRLEVQAGQLEAWRRQAHALHARAESEPGVASALELFEARVSLALKTAEEGAAAMAAAGDEADTLGRLAAWSRQLLDHETNRLTSARPLQAIAERALGRATDDELALELAALAADLQGMGLARAHSHIRINAVQLHNAVRKQLGMDHPPDDPSYRLSYLDALGELIDKVEPARVNFGTVNAERTTARRIFMLMAQLVKVIDEDEPLRFLVAETDSAFTLLAALYFAKLFAIDDKIDISPLFETEKGLERGAGILREALERPAYRDYVRRRGRLCLQTGYSDAGRYLGQTAAAVTIERLKLELADLLEELGLGAVEVVVFDTHGESIGRGAHPGSFGDRLAYLEPPETRRRFAARGIRTKQETSFQGGDGYMLFAHPAAVDAVVTRVLEHVLTPPAPAADAFYTDDVYAAEFFTLIQRYFAALVDNADYAALLGAFGSNMLDPAGSRAVRRQHEGGAPQNLEHPSQLRAIPNNAILQQLGFLANSLGGAGAAIAKDPERFRSLYADSDRFRRLVGMIEHAFMYSDPTVLRAHVDVLDPAMWLLRGARAQGDADQECYRAVADGCDRLRAHDKLERVFRVLMRDYLDLAHGLREHRRVLRAQGAVPIAIAPETRDNMHLLNALRLACILRLFAMSARIPEFSGRHEMTREEVVQLILHLDVEAAVAALARIFPFAQPSTLELDWGELATYADTDGQSYRQDHEQLFIPLTDVADRIRRISAALVHHLGAVG